jgi:GT2 family glycosyltransferase
MTATVIIPTTGSPDLKTSLESVLNQTYPTKCYVVIDGDNFSPKAKTIISNYLGNKNLYVCQLPINVGANGFYGHRVYAAFTHLIDTDYVLYLDQDNWFDKNHVQSCVEMIESKDYDWCFSLRKICDKDGQYVCDDNCESLGRWPTYHGLNHIDTNSYCIKTKVAQSLAQVWHGGWGQDRVFYSVLDKHYNNYTCTGQYTVNYRVDGNPGSVTSSFFINGNKIMNEKYNGEFPWIRKI